MAVIRVAAIQLKPRTDLIRSIEGVPLPQPKVVAQAGQGEEILTADLDLEKAREARRYWLDRRRPALYGLLCSREGRCRKLGG